MYNILYYSPNRGIVSTVWSQQIGSFNSPVGGISESRRLILGATSRLRLFKENG